MANGFIEFEREYSEEFFGNEYVTYRSSSIKIRIVKDRGFFSIEALPVLIDRNDWVSLARVTGFLKWSFPELFKETARKSDQWDDLIDDICSNLPLIDKFLDFKSFYANEKILDSFGKRPK